MAGPSFDFQKGPINLGDNIQVTSSFANNREMAKRPCGAYSLRDITIYVFLTCLSTIGFGIMIWTYACPSLFSTNGRQNLKAWTSRGFVGFDVLIVLHLIVPLWLLANLYHILVFSRAIQIKFAAIYELCLGISFLGISTYCLIFLDRTNKTCLKDGSCARSWNQTRSRLLAAVLLGLIVGIVHIFSCLYRIYSELYRKKNRINVLSRSLNSSELGGLGFLRYYTWTDEEMISILRIKGLTDEARDNIVSALYDVQTECVPTREREP